MAQSPRGRPIIKESHDQACRIHAEPETGAAGDRGRDGCSCGCSRSDLALTGTKYGCGEAHCGACTVVVNGKAVRSCQTPLKEVAGKEVLTIEGLERKGELHPLQKAFVDHERLSVRLLYPGHDHERNMPSSWNTRRLQRRISSRAWKATSAAARLTAGSSKPSRRRPKR